jgi:NADH-quinone oxidoreductase subunit J
LPDAIVFGIAAFLIVASALMVVVNRHPVHSALYLVLSFLGLYVFYLQLQAPFLAAVQVIVYASAIMVLFLFVIMLLGEDKPLGGVQKLGAQKWLGPAFSLILVAEITYLIVNQKSQVLANSTRDQVQLIGGGSANFGSVAALGNTLFTNYIFAFEATSVVLMVAMVGVVVLAKKRL